MDQTLSTELRYLYMSTEEHARVIRIRIRMRDLISLPVLRRAVETTMKRYPYFCVELKKKDGAFVFAQNDRPVVVFGKEELAQNDRPVVVFGKENLAQNDRLTYTAGKEPPVKLNSPETNMHLLAFSCHENWIVMDVFHGLTDGIGAYEVVRTLLYYYCSERYHVKLQDEGIRIPGEIILPEEWENPIDRLCRQPAQTEQPAETDKQQGPTQKQTEQPPETERQQGSTQKQTEQQAEKMTLTPALNLICEGNLKEDKMPVVYSVSVSEAEFMRFNMDHDGSPGTMVSLFLSRAIAALHPDCRKPIRIALCVDLRHALKAPRAHQSLVSGAMLEYKDAMRAWSLDKQATAFRGMVILQTQEERLLSGAAAQYKLAEKFLSEPSDSERVEIAKAISEKMIDAQTATVSYVGKANYKEAEGYIRDFRTWAQASVPLLIEISAVNGKFTLDFIQSFSSPVYVNAFLAELEQQDITYDLQDVMPLTLPSMLLPWE